MGWRKDEVKGKKKGGSSRNPRRVVELVSDYCLFFPLTAPAVMAFPLTCPETLKATAISLTEWYMATEEKEEGKDEGQRSFSFSPSFALPSSLRDPESR